MNENRQHSLAQATEKSRIDVGTNVIFELQVHHRKPQDLRGFVIEVMAAGRVLIAGRLGGHYNRHVSEVRRV